jgi:hypothetical protein
MVIGRGVQSTHIHASKVYTRSKGVHGFAHLWHGTYQCTTYSTYDTVQSARDMNLSLINKPPTEISVSPDIVSSIVPVFISNCIFLKRELFILLTGLISPKYTSGYLIPVRYIFFLLP